MVELVDTRDLGSRAVRRVGSSPTTRTTSRFIGFDKSAFFSFVFLDSFCILGNLFLTVSIPCATVRIERQKTLYSGL